VKKANWRPFALFGLMIVVMLGLMAVFGSMFSAMNPMVSLAEGLGMWGVMAVPLVGLLVMLVMMFVFFRLMARGGGLMSMRMGHRSEPMSQSQQGSLATLTFSVPTVSCAHCKMTIEQAVGNLPGVASVNVDVDTKHAVIQLIVPPTRAEIGTLLTEIGYPPESQ
jgi:copper chaperone CopZ